MVTTTTYYQQFRKTRELHMATEDVRMDLNKAVLDKEMNQIESQVEILDRLEQTVCDEVKKQIEPQK